jgi:hypothetical protein
VRRWVPFLASALVAAAAFEVRPAAAFCRTTTCDPLSDPERCRMVMGCATAGEPLFWPDACVTYAVQLDGSPRRGISALELDQSMQKAFTAWLGAECPRGGRPSLGVIPLGTASCDRVEFNPPVLGRGGAPNANIVMFRDDAWPYPGERFVIARTSITFDPNTGAIFDADIEINSFDNVFSMSETSIENDLQAVLTHEVGHFIGLDHSLFENATMQANYDLENLGARILSSDDTAGVCAIYSPDPELVGVAPSCPGNTGPHHGFSRECGSDASADGGCLSLTGSPPPRSLVVQAVCGLLGAALLCARRRRQ